MAAGQRLLSVATVSVLIVCGPGRYVYRYFQWSTATLALMITVMSLPTKYWFPAKSYGWGWGAPSTWQGWAVFGAVAALLFGASVLFPPDTAPLAAMTSAGTAGR